MASRLGPVVDWDSEARRVGYDLNALAQVFRVTLRRIEQRFRDEGRPTPRKWIRWLKMEHARVRIEAGIPCKVVSIELGYGDYTHFRRAFHRHFGCPPRAFATKPPAREFESAPFSHSSTAAALRA